MSAGSSALRLANVRNSRSDDPAQDPLRDQSVSLEGLAHSVSSSRYKWAEHPKFQRHATNKHDISVYDRIINHRFISCGCNFDIRSHNRHPKPLPPSPNLKALGWWNSWNPWTPGAWVTSSGPRTKRAQRPVPSGCYRRAESGWRPRCHHLLGDEGGESNLDVEWFQNKYGTNPGPQHVF